MLKTFFLTLLLAMMSFAVLAQDQLAAQIFEQEQFTDLEVNDFIARYPELESLQIASVAKIPTENGFTLKLYGEKTNDVYIIEKSPAQSEIEKTFVPFEVTNKSFEGEIRGTLYETLKEDLKSEKIARQISEAFKEDFTTTRGLKVAANYSFEVIEYLDHDLPVKFGDVVKATLYVGKAVSERVLQQDLETLAWHLLPLDPAKNEKPFYAPVKMSRVSSLFNLARKHPVKRRIQPHNGIDFVAKAGTPVYPALDGVIVAIGRARAKGKFILIEHENGYQTTYDHLRKFTKGLRVGSKVELNDQIGEVGRTGYATGAHLHFGVLRDGLYVNPIYLVKDYTFDQKDLYEIAEAEEESAE